MNNNPTFSIIVATFNSGKVLENCLNSIFCQTEKDYEVIVIDGASTDETLGILQNANARKENFFSSEKDSGISLLLIKVFINPKVNGYIYWVRTMNTIKMFCER